MTSWTVHNGTSVDVGVTISHPHGPKTWCTLMLTSEASLATNAVQGDASHFWNVGLMVGRP
jgi:hypothetical protein